MCLGRDPARETAAEIYTSGKPGRKQPGLDAPTLSLVLTRDHSFLSTLQISRTRKKKGLHWQLKVQIEQFLSVRRDQSLTVHLTCAYWG